MSAELVRDPSLNIYQIEQTLVDLMIMRDGDETTPEERAVIDGEIKKYVAQEIRKVDNLRGYLRHCGLMQSAAKQEAARLTALADSWKSRAERLKEFCKLVMEQFGIKRIEGKTGLIFLKGNGGLEPITITDASLVPEECCLYEGTISGGAWKDLRELVSCSYSAGREAPEYWDDWKGRSDVQMARVPNNGLIRAALKAGPVAGVQIGERGSHLEVK